MVEALPNATGEGISLLRYNDMQDRLHDFVQTVPCRIWAIMHDLDELDDHTRKREHWHIVIETKTRRTCTGIVKNLADVLNVSPNRVSVRECRDMISSIRYLMHLDDEDKFLYNAFDVITNDRDGLIEALNRPFSDMTVDDLLEIINKSDNEIDIMRRIGLKQFVRYRSVIRDILFIKRKV